MPALQPPIAVRFRARGRELEGLARFWQPERSKVFIDWCGGTGMNYSDVVDAADVIERLVPDQIPRRNDLPPHR